MTARLPDGIRLSGVRKTYGRVEAVARADLRVPKGSVTALVGPSGCGKTTTLRMVAGLVEPDRGTVWIDDVAVAGAAAPRWVPPEERRVGVVFQHLALFPHLDVAGNVGYGLGRAGRKARVSELLELVGLAGYGRRLPHELSGGQAQRVAVARAMAPRPRVVVLDEPFSSLDVGLRDEVRAEVIDALRAEATTTLLVTHDQDEALAMGDQVAVMLDGRIAQVGAPEQVYRHPVDVAVGSFLGEANLLDGHVSGGVLKTVLGPFKVDAPDGAAVALVRPEDVDVEPAATGRATVQEVEYFGHDQRVAVRVGGDQIVHARLHARRKLEIGAKVRLKVGGLGPVIFPREPHEPLA